MVDLAPAEGKARFAALGNARRLAADSMQRFIGNRRPVAASLFLAAGAVLAALLMSLFLSQIVHVPFPVSAQVPFYVAIFVATRIRGLVSGIAALVLALGASDFFLAEPLYELLPIYDVPEFFTFGLAAAGSLGVGLLGRKLAGRAQR
jgi:K+-sensing histidine kinase KdpD